MDKNLQAFTRTTKNMSQHVHISLTQNIYSHLSPLLGKHRFTFYLVLPALQWT